MDSDIADAELGKALARSSTYKLFAKAFLYPSPEVIEFIIGDSKEGGFCEYVSSSEPNGKSRELVPLTGLVQSCCAVLSSQNWMEHVEELEREYNRLFAHLGSAKCPPYETEYGYDNIFQKTQAMADISGFYRAYDLEVADINAERVDFISTELEFMSYLALHEAYAREHNEHDHLAICLDTQRTFVRDHLGRWASLFSTVLSKASENPFYVSLGRLMDQFLDTEARRLNVEVSKVTAPNRVFSEGPGPFECAGCVSTASREAGENRPISS
jgi:TorA maturation chaperone TorD